MWASSMPCDSILSYNSYILAEMLWRGPLEKKHTGLHVLGHAPTNSGFELASLPSSLSIILKGSDGEKKWE